MKHYVVVSPLSICVEIDKLDKKMFIKAEHSIKRKLHFYFKWHNHIQLYMEIIQFASDFLNQADQAKLRTISMLHGMIEVWKSIFYVIHYWIS